MLAAIIVVSCLVLFSVGWRRPAAGFSRVFYKAQTKQVNNVPLPATIRDIINIADSSIYFETGNPSLIYKLSGDLKNLQQVHLPIKQNEAINSFFITTTDSPFVYVAAGNVPMMVKMQFGTGVVNYIRVPPKTFSACVQVSQNTFVFRMFKNFAGSWDQIFVKTDLANESTIEEECISPKNGDAGISTDGQLLYDKFSSELVYVHFYNNTIVGIDTNLNPLYTMHTIDTGRGYVVNVTKYSNGTLAEYTNGNPVHGRNILSNVNNGLLYILSGIKADNESSKPFKNNAVIDVYALNEKKYNGSFYIPKYDGIRPRAFKVYNNRFYALYKKRLICYQVPFQ